MKTVLKVISITFIAVFAIVGLLYFFLNCGIASTVAESVLEKKTGCEVNISGFHISPATPFPAVAVAMDSVYMENGQDSTDVRIRAIDAQVSFKKKGIATQLSLGESFFRIGSNRIILGNIKFTGKYKDTNEYAATIDLSESKFISTMFPLKTRLDTLSIDLDNDNVFIDTLSVKSGTTNARVNGMARNWMKYVKGICDLDIMLDVQSDNVNVNELLAGIYYGKPDGREHYQVSDENDESFIVVDKYVGYPFLIKIIIPLIIPDRINVSGELKVGRALVSILSMSNISSRLDVMNKTAKISDIKLNSNLGKIDATMFYSSPCKENLLVGADLKLRELTAKKIAAILPEMNGISPLLNSLKGEFSCKATMTSQVDTAFIPILKTIKGVVNFKGDDMCVTDAGKLRKYTSLLMFRDKNIGDIDDVNLYAIISDSKIKVFPMLLGVDRYLLAMSGSHTFENAFDYDISVLESPVPFKFGISLHNDGGKKSKIKFKFKDATYRNANIPKYYSEVSDAHIRLSKEIANVMDQGGAVTDAKSANITRELFDRHKNIKASSLTGPESEMQDSVKRYYKNFTDLP